MNLFYTLSKLLIFINCKNLRTIWKLIAYDNFQVYITWKRKAVDFVVRFHVFRQARRRIFRSYPVRLCTGNLSVSIWGKCLHSKQLPVSARVLGVRSGIRPKTESVRILLSLPSNDVRDLAVPVRDQQSRAGEITRCSPETLCCWQEWVLCSLSEGSYSGTRLSIKVFFPQCWGILHESWSPRSQPYSPS